jgi:hypothetical protein
LKLHYYPEGGWGWVILFCACLSQCLSYGMLLSTGTLLTSVTRRFSFTYGYPWTSHPATSTTSTAVTATSSTFSFKPLVYSSLEPSLLARYRPVYHSLASNYSSSVVAPPLAGLSWPFFLWKTFHLIYSIGGSTRLASCGTAVHHPAGGIQIPEFIIFLAGGNIRWPQKRAGPEG